MMMRNKVLANKCQRFCAVAFLHAPLPAASKLSLTPEKDGPMPSLLKITNGGSLQFIK